MVDKAGGRSQLAQLTMALVVIIVLLFLTVPLGYMPNAVLAAVVFLIGVELVDVKGMRTILRLRPVEFIVALRKQGVTFALCDVQEPVMKELRRDGLLEIIGEEHVLDTPADVLRAYRALPPDTGAKVAQ
jgi:MFS superfamily sulfate permease-like transporter